MIQVSEARELVLQHFRHSRALLMPLTDVNGYILAADLQAPSNTPPFDQSAMDGYAFSFINWDKKSPLLVTGEVNAGNYSSNTLNALESVRIFTGAALPPGADTVVIQEKVVVEGNSVIINDERLVKGSNVRPLGSQTKKGTLALSAGTALTPAAISFIASMGISQVAVFEKPSVGIIVTGKELVKPGTAITGGKIFESNSFGLVAALGQLGIAAHSVKVVDDDETEIINAVSDQLKLDILIITGGISTGDYDLVAAALKACGVQEVFHGVKQKPGKPFYFGTAGNMLVFALPGNPAAVLTCFYTFIVPAISRFTQKEYFKTLMMPLAADHHKKPGMTHFLKGKTGDGFVTVLENQESYTMNSFAMADCLIELEAEKEYFTKGDMVHVNMIV